MLPGIVGMHAVIGASESGTGGGGGGSTPALQATGTLVDNGANSDPVQVPWPVGVAADDIAILEAMIWDSTAANGINVPSGWTAVFNGQLGGSTASAHGVFWKRCAGTESGTQGITATSGHAATDTFCGIMSIWRGCKASGDPYEGLATNSSSASGGNSVNMRGAAVTTTGANRRVVHYCANGRAESATPAAGWTENYDAATTNGTPDGSVHMYSKEKAAAGTEAAATHTLSGSRAWQTVAFALIPA
jgi:hypothetical protein